MKCSVCGRKLTSHKSQEVGYGPVCYRRLFGYCLQENDNRDQKPMDVMTNYEVPVQLSMDDYLQMSLK